MLGVAGLIGAYHSGNIGLANALGTGRRRRQGDLSVRSRDDPLLPEGRADPGQRRDVPAARSRRTASTSWRTSTSWWSRRSTAPGGYGMLIGPASTREQREEFARKIEANPRGYIAQPTISLSRHPTFVDGRLDGRHIDLRPFVLYGEEIVVMPGGLTRVALPEGSLVVNSSQGGGTKDTWVLHDGAARSRPARCPLKTASRGTTEMLSRVAENLFWMSRYLERAENVARLLDIGLFLELDAPTPAVEDGSAPVEIALHILACREAFHSAHPEPPTATRSWDS